MWKPQESVVPIHLADVKLFHWICEDFDLLVALAQAEIFPPCSLCWTSLTNCTPVNIISVICFRLCRAPEPQDILYNFTSCQVHLVKSKLNLMFITGAALNCWIIKVHSHFADQIMY